MCAAHIAADWGSYILQDGLPSYLRDVLGFSLTMSGILAALPTLLQALVGFTAAHLADWLRRPRPSPPAAATAVSSVSAASQSSSAARLHTATVRKLLSSMAMLPAAALLALLGLGLISAPDAVIFALIATSGISGTGARRINWPLVTMHD